MSGHTAVPHAGGPLPGREQPHGHIDILGSIEAVPADQRIAAMTQDAQEIAAVLRRTLPQGTLDRLALQLMERLVSDRLRAMET